MNEAINKIFDLKSRFEKEEWGAVIKLLDILINE